MLAVELGELCKVMIPKGRATQPARRAAPTRTKGIEPCLPLGIDGVPAILEELVMQPMAKSGIGLVREGTRVWPCCCWKVANWETGGPIRCWM